MTRAQAELPTAHEPSPRLSMGTAAPAPLCGEPLAAEVAVPEVAVTGSDGSGEQGE